MAVHECVRCPGCGFERSLRYFGLTPEGSFDPNLAQPNELLIRRTTIGGRGRCSVERFPAPLSLALGMRAMLKYRLELIEADIRAAGVELED